VEDVGRAIGGLFSDHAESARPKWVGGKDLLGPRMISPERMGRRRSLGLLQLKQQGRPSNTEETTPPDESTGTGRIKRKVLRQETPL